MSYERKETYSAEQILKDYNHQKPMFLDGDMILPSGRYLNFKLHGTKCVNCGLEGTYFAKERSKGAKGSYEKFHLNLYGINAHGREVMLTKDHIIPKSWGGVNHIDNYQPMCAPCNGRKGDKIETKFARGVTIGELIRERSA